MSEGREVGREVLYMCGAADQIIKNIHFRKFTAFSWAPEVAAYTCCFNLFFFFQAITDPKCKWKEMSSQIQL